MSTPKAFQFGFHLLLLLQLTFLVKNEDFSDFFLTFGDFLDEFLLARNGVRTGIRTGRGDIENMIVLLFYSVEKEVQINQLVSMKYTKCTS